MPLPFIIGGLAALAGVIGVGSGIQGGMKMVEANGRVEEAKKKHKNAIDLFEKRNKETVNLMDSVGKYELGILKNFNEFSNLIEKIQGRPHFKEYQKEGIQLPKFESEELKKVSMGADVLLGGIGGAAVGTAGGFAAAGATTSAVMALGTASTGAAISSLSGVAATNATLAALGGGAISAGGGGMALGSAILGGATLGVGLLIGGVIFNVTGSKLSDQADEAYSQAERTEKEVNKIISYFNDLSFTANNFKAALEQVEEQYKKRLTVLDYVINTCKKYNWNEFTDREKQVTENLVLLVGLLYKMCKVKLVLKASDSNEVNRVNRLEVNEVIDNSKKILKNLETAA